MKDLKSGYIFLSVLLMIALSGTFAVAEYHHVEDCTVCHYSGKQEDSEGCNNCPNIKHVRCEIDTPNSDENKQVVFTGPYVSGEEPYDGVCEVCHTQTLVHINTGDGVNHFDGQDCITCHRHAQPGDPFSVVPAYAPQSHGTHVRGNKGPAVSACTDCHLNHTDYTVFSDGQPFATTTACDDCHSPGGVFPGANGLDDPDIGAKANWEYGVYEPDGETLKLGKKDWCATCHDDEPANSKVDGTGIYAPNVMGDSAGTYGYNISGHGRPSAGLKCTKCHYAPASHIDHEHRTYELKEYPLPVEVVNPYTESYRLRPEPSPQLVVPRYDPEVGEFALCTQCHDLDDLLLEGRSLFRDFGDDNPLHTVHLTFGSTAARTWDSDWDGEIFGSSPSLVSCPTCHNPHGSSMHVDGPIDGTWEACQVMIRDGGLTHHYYDHPPEGYYGMWFHWFQENNCFSSADYQFTSSRTASRSGYLMNDAPYCWLSCHGGKCYNRVPYNCDGEPSGEVLVDDFEEYADGDGLNSNWLGAEDAQDPYLEPNGGPCEEAGADQCMRVFVRWMESDKVYGYVERTYAEYIDLAAMDSVTFYVKVETVAKVKEIRVKLKKYSDDTWCKAEVAVNSDNGFEDDVWKLVSVPRESFDDTSWAKVNAIRFRIVENDPDKDKRVNVYFDDIGYVL